ncbi:sugar ABC transporter permease [Leifsonia sp. LS1]|uniref:carbohydrate ABC transporter permease n=1 Tax=Leifsonia sp. LS1 TaxID=2828483 RepID=UPI001CFDFCA6|nr:carbohydrate ABC transporter permease [Leifsonia sp. LS1]GIT80615.1 sugar ABC transporter permease [Leifsonia sp. LS1]
MSMSTAAIRRRPVRVLLLVAAIAASVYALLPLAWAAVGAFRPESDIFRFMDPLSWQSFVPVPFTFDNVRTVLESSFPLALGNSLLVTVLTVVIGLAVCIPAAFALSALEFRGRNVVFAVILVSFLIPFDSIAIPLSSTFRTLQLQDSFLGILLPGIANGLAIFQLRQFFLSIPAELKEAARIDGLGWFGIMRRVYMPLATPAIIGAALLLFVFQWQSYLWPLLVAPDPQFVLAPIAIANYAGEHSVAYGAIFLAGIVTALVPLAVLLFTQRYFTASIATTGSKG